MEARSHRPSQVQPTVKTSKLGRHTSSSETRLVTRETKRESLEMAPTFTTDLVMRAIKSCRNSKAFGPNKLSIFHLKHFGPRAIEYITALFNLSITAIWKSSLIIPIQKPGKDTSVGTSYRPISLLCPAAKVLESLPTINKYLQQGYLAVGPGFGCMTPAIRRSRSCVRSGRRRGGFVVELRISSAAAN